MAEFDQAWSLTEINEGGYANDPADPGGETYMGISRVYNPSWSGWSIVDENKPLKTNEIIADRPDLDDLVVSFYKSSYWDYLMGDQVTSQTIMNFLFDWHVTSGAWPIIHLQRILVVNPIGKFDQVTFDALNNSDYPSVYSQLIQARATFYDAVVQSHPTEQKFLAGWMNRDNSYPSEDKADEKDSLND